MGMLFAVFSSSVMGVGCADLFAIGVLLPGIPLEITTGACIWNYGEIM
jgi:hypothetical protein